MKNKILNLHLYVACFLVASIIGYTHSQVTICSSYENDISYLGNDLSFTYDPMSPSGLHIFFNSLSSVH